MICANALGYILQTEKLIDHFTLLFTDKAVCTSCRKKHAEQLVALGWQSTDKRTKDKVDQASAASPTDLQRFVGKFFFE